MHVRGEGGWPHHPVGGDAVGRGVEPTRKRHKVISHHNMIALPLGIQGICQSSSTDPFCKAVVGS